MRSLVKYIYCLPIPVVLFAFFISVLVWTIINKRHDSNEQFSFVLRCLNRGLLLVNIFAILYITIWAREVGKRELCLIPFYTFVIAQGQPEMYRSMFMNMLLFVPYGVAMPYVLRKSYQFKIIFTILSGFLFSIGIEVAQYLFMLGRTEIDDVACNTLGVVIGSVSFYIYNISAKD